MKYNLPILIISAFFLLVGCADSPQLSSASSDSNAMDVPELLERSAAIQNGKEWETVQNVFQKNSLALQNNPENNDPYLKLTQLYIQEARVTGEHGHYYPAALAMTDAVLNSPNVSKDERFQALSMKAGVLLSLHEFAAALEIAKEAVALNPYNAQIHGALVDAYVELGDYPAAVKNADLMIAIRPDIRSYSRVSYLREIHGDVEGAKEALQMAVKAGYPGYEDTAWAMLTLGNLYAEYGDLAEAEKIYQQILATRENYPFAHGALAEIQYQKGDLAKAEQTLNTAISAIPEVGFYVQLAHIKKDQNKQQELNQLLDEIMVMLQEDTDSGHNMNLEYAALHRDLTGDLDQALTFAQIEYAKRPANIDVNRLLATIYTQQGKTQLAKKHFAVAASTNSKNPELLSMLD